MASVKPLFGPDGKPRAYKVRYWTPAHEARSQTFRRKGDADRFAVSVESSKMVHAFIDPRDARITVAEYGEVWRAAQHHKPNTARRIRAVFGCHLYPALGDRPIGSVTHTDMQALLKRRVALAAPSTVRGEWSWIQTLFAAAVADRKIAFSPCSRVRLELAETPRVTVPTLEEIDAITARLPARWAAVGLLGAQSGLRPGELRGLCVEQVDFLRGTITVDRQQLAGRIVATPKTRASRRVVPIADDTVDLLAGHLAAYGPGDGGVIFSEPDGRSVETHQLGRAWAAAAGAGRRVRLHDMRHFYASALIAEGASVLAVMARLGHKTAKETTDTYGHLFPAEEDRTRAMIGAVFSRRASSSAS